MNLVINTLDELLAHAHELEREAVERYEELADQMEVHNQPELAKLFAEAIEEISPKPLEAVRASGAPFAAVVVFAVMPQVMSRFVGFALYQLDSNLRNSTMVGLVGAGGIGGTLDAAFKRFDFDFVSAILIAIIAMIFVGEILSGWVRRAFQ